MMLHVLIMQELGHALPRLSVNEQDQMLCS